MPLRRSDVKKILVISLTNIGDCILTLPVMDVLRRDFPEAELSVVIGPKSASLLFSNPKFKNVYIYDKRQPVMKTIAWVWALRREKFDLVIDLRNSFTPFLIAPRWRTPAAKIRQERNHMREKHLARLRSVHDFLSDKVDEKILDISSNDIAYVDGLLAKPLGRERPFVAVAPGSAYHAKRWSEENFAALIEEINIRFELPVIFVGDERDKKVVEAINTILPIAETDLTGLTSLAQLVEIIRRAKLIITNDSAPMHLASYLNRPVLAIFGPSDPVQYGPWSENAAFVQAPSSGKECEINTITPEMVLAKLKYENGSFRVG